MHRKNNYKEVWDKSISQLTEFLLAYTDPPVGVQGFCSSVVWYTPEVPCQHIYGYEVRLYHPQSAHQNVTRHVGASEIFYIVEENSQDRSDDTYVQV